MTKQISVLLIEDDPMVQEVNRQFIERVPAFTVVATADNGLEGLVKIKEMKPDLVILDIFMPNLNGVDTLYQIRKEQLDVDVIIISAANDQKTIRKMMQNGAFDYLIKPFNYERLKHTLEQYYAFRMEVEPGHAISQIQLDRILFQNQTSTKPVLKNDVPKGLNKSTLDQVTKFVQTMPGALSAEDVADGIGIARVTARRYLEYLHEKEILQLDVQYGNVGRPVNRYRLHKA